MSEAEQDSGSSSEHEEQEVEPPFGPAESFLFARSGEAYLHGIARPARTSNTRFSSNVKGLIDQQAFLSATSSNAAIKDFGSMYKTRFLFWRIELEQGFSLLFHGIGSKRTVLNGFAKEELSKHGAVVVFNGFLASASISDLLNAIEKITPKEEEDSRLQKIVSARTADKNEGRVLKIRRLMHNSPQPLFLVIHNIDGLALRGGKAQKLLALLASHPSIRLSASVDHLRATLLFPQSRVLHRPSSTITSQDAARGFHFVHHHIPTYAPAAVESALSGTPSSVFAPNVYPALASIRSSKTAASQIQATLSVLASMNDNAKFVFKALANVQAARIEEATTATDTATPSYACTYNRLFTQCRDSFVASTETQFETLLTEFRDHDIVLTSSVLPASDAMEDGEGDDDHNKSWLWVNLEADSLKIVLEKME